MLKRWLDASCLWCGSACSSEPRPHNHAQAQQRVNAAWTRSERDSLKLPHKCKARSPSFLVGGRGVFRDDAMQQASPAAAQGASSKTSELQQPAWVRDSAPKSSLVWFYCCEVLFLPFGGAGVCFYRFTSSIFPCLARPQGSRRRVRGGMRVVARSKF